MAAVLEALKNPRTPGVRLSPDAAAGAEVSWNSGARALGGSCTGFHEGKDPPTLSRACEVGHGTERRCGACHRGGQRSRDDDRFAWPVLRQPGGGGAAGNSGERELFLRRDRGAVRTAAADQEVRVRFAGQSLLHGFSSLQTPGSRNRDRSFCLLLSSVLGSTTASSERAC